MSSASHVPPPRVANLALPGAVMAVLAIGGYLAFNPSLESSRPQPSGTELPGPPSPLGLSGGYSRLWEDPLEAAQKLSSDTPKLAETKKRMKELVVHGLAAAHGHVRGGETRFHVMTVLLPGEPHAESSETRRRIRYAVTSALGVAGYHLEFPDRITYVDIPMNVEIKAVESERPITLRVPIKLYRTAELHNHEAIPATSRVLVLWVNESRLGKSPIQSICSLQDTLFSDVKPKCRSRMKFSIIGPTSSDTLLTMAKEVDRWNDPQSESSSIDNKVRWPLETTTIYSYRATIGGDELEDPKVMEKLFAATQMRYMDSTEATPNTESASRAPQVVRTIGTDRQLVDELFRELRLRQAMPEDDDCGDRRHIVILTERDTLYGRGLRELFRFKEETTERPEFGICKPNLHLFTYLRGIDGQSITTPDSHSRSDEFPTGNLSNHETDLPTGTSQYDYIRRVAQQVVQLQSRLRRSGRGQITAVGVMGTDVYDKLLIMRALRPRLANAVYFTTDLDAALSHASEYDWTRNLVVASHFGRQLHPSLQREAPVFRDSYQTSCFFSALLATEDDVARKLFADEESRNDPWRLSRHNTGADESRYLSPLVFEISRAGPYQLTSTGGPWHTEEWYDQLREKDSRKSSLAGLVHPPGDRYVRSISGKGAVLLIVSVMMILVCMAASFSSVRGLLASFWKATVRFWKRCPEPTDWVLILSVLAAVVLVVVVFVDGHRSNGEPITLVGGISIWPTVILRAVATALAVYFTVKAIRSVREREELIAKEFCLNDSVTDEVHDDSENRSVFTQAVQFAVDRWHWRNLLPDRIYRKNAPSNESIEKKWRRLTQRTRPGSIVARVTPQIILFGLFAYYLWPLGDPRSLPVRGGVASITELISFLASLIGIFVLTFVVLDLTQCGRYFAKAIRKTSKMKWPDPYLTKYAGKDKALPELIGYRATIEVLALLSKTYSNLIIYPSMVVVILIFAHLTVFDNWILPWPILLLTLLCISAAIYGNISLRNEIRKVREVVLRLVRRERFETTQKATAKGLHQFDQVIEEIGAERGGAFRPLTEDPLIQAISLPFGGVGGAVILVSAT